MKAEIMIILKDARKKIEEYNRNYGKYDMAYEFLLTKYRNSGFFIESSGHVSQETIEIIRHCLENFDMKFIMRKDFSDVLFKKLQPLTSELQTLKNERFETVDLTSSKIKESMRALYDALVEYGANSLHIQQKRFDVGATKIMHFLHPELFIMIDSNVADVLKKYYSLPYRSGTLKEYSFDKYHHAMIIYRNEIKLWIDSGKTLGELLSFDRQPTTVTRALDKCAYVMND